MPYLSVLSERLVIGWAWRLSFLLTRRDGLFREGWAMVPEQHGETCTSAIQVADWIYCSVHWTPQTLAPFINIEYRWEITFCFKKKITKFQQGRAGERKSGSGDDILYYIAISWGRRDWVWGNEMERECHSWSFSISRTSGVSSCLKATRKQTVQCHNVGAQRKWLEFLLCYLQTIAKVNDG